MIVKKKKDQALDCLNSIVSCYDRLFGHISPVVSKISSTAMINEVLLTNSNIEWIHHLSNGLSSVIEIVSSIEEESSTLLDEVKQLREKYTEEQKRSHLLQDFLVNEIANSDMLGHEIRSLKEVLASTIKQRDNYKEKCDSQIQELRMLEAKSTIQNTSNSKTGINGTTNNAPILSQTLLGKYIKKVFKGYGTFYAVVVGYEKPYYKLVYEDGDSEEMTREEVLAALCTEEEVAKLSPSKTETISKISEEFDFKNPELCFRGILSNPPTGNQSIEISELNETNTSNKSQKVVKSSSSSSLPSLPSNNCKKVNIHIDNERVINIIDDDDDDGDGNGNDDENGNDFSVEFLDFDDFKDKSYNSHRKKENIPKSHILLRDRDRNFLSPKKEEDKNIITKATNIDTSTSKNDNARKRRRDSDGSFDISEIKVKSEGITHQPHTSDMIRNETVSSPAISLVSSSSSKQTQDSNSLKKSLRNGKHHQNGNLTDTTTNSNGSVCSIDSDS